MIQSNYAPPASARLGSPIGCMPIRTWASQQAMDRARWSAHRLEYWLILGVVCLLALGLGLRLHEFLIQMIGRFHGHF